MREVTKQRYSRVRALAEPSGGFIHADTLAAAGIVRTTIESWLECGRLVRAWHRVYAVGHVPAEPRARGHGAMLAAGEGAALARGSAAAFYDAVRDWPATCQLVSPRRCRGAGLDMRSSSTLLLRDVWRFDGLRVTSPARTALDLAAETTDDRLKSIVDHLRLRHHLSLSQLADVLVRNPRHRGAGRLTRVAAQAGSRATRSKLEREIWPAFAKAFDLPPYEQNQLVAGHEVDVLVDGVVIVELDTLLSHLLNFKTDRRRDAAILAATGLSTIRVLDEQLEEEPEQVAAHILAVVRREHEVRAMSQTGDALAVPAPSRRPRARGK